MVEKFFFSLVSINEETGSWGFGAKRCLGDIWRTDPAQDQFRKNILETLDTVFTDLVHSLTLTRSVIKHIKDVKEPIYGICSWAGSRNLQPVAQGNQ